MKSLYVRELTSEEYQALEKGQKTQADFTVRRSQILLHSASGLKAALIAEQLQCSDEIVRATIHAFHTEGLACLEQKSSRPQSAIFSVSDEALKQLLDIVATSPRMYGLEHSLWSLERLAQVCYQEGLTTRVLSYETMRDALQRVGIDWKRARKRMAQHRSRRCGQDLLDTLLSLLVPPCNLCTSFPAPGE
jgi:transposase